ncbi:MULTISPECIES: alanine dehydrogenase [Flammeovirga]|uniref:alanine dehydrogenase n=1 Tax=Flammeovirga agarivorans TaxID=2726742 RepID=A0A7X8SR08_9BACT|nr:MULTISPECIES: alanine dehydrogenase [Flammeovirga]NLR94815.1 alanine dehydrogenase [Flammeovirga agarivorans]
MGKQREGFEKATESYFQFHPQEVMEGPVHKRGNPLKIGVPKEINLDEKRCALRPGAISLLINNGCEVYVETNAGKHVNHLDNEYSEAGATIVYSHKEVMECDIVIKISAPTIDEIADMKQGKAIISTIHMREIKKDVLVALNKKKITALGFELIEDKVGGLPLVRAMSEIAGSTVMLIAAEYLSSYNGGKGIILGGITGVPPSKVVILGAGTVAEYAARTAIGMGAEVKVFDNAIYKLRRLKKELNYPHLFTSALDSTSINEALKRADVVIGAIHTHGARTPSIVTEEMVMDMRENSIIIDVCIDQGGCFETSEPTNHRHPVYKKHGVIHYCVPNIASRVSRTATAAISNIFTPILMKINDEMNVDTMMRRHPWFSKGVYTYRGSITNQAIAEKFNLPLKNLDLILAAGL